MDALTKRDARSCYQGALSVAIPNTLGIFDPYEPAQQPEVAVRTHNDSTDQSVWSIVSWIETGRLLP